MLTEDKTTVIPKDTSETGDIRAAQATSTLGAIDPTRKTSLVAGILYLITFIASIAAVLLQAPVLNNPNYIISTGADNQVIFGASLDLVNALACIGTAVALFWVVKRENESFALGFVATRIFEAATIVVGVVCILAIVSLRQAGAVGTDAATLVITGKTLLAIRNWTFAIGPSLMPALNALLLGTLIYRSRLVPRIIPTAGLIGGPLLISSFILTLFGISIPVWSLIAVAPIFFWEGSLGVWMVIKGFNRTAPLIVAITAEKRWDKKSSVLLIGET